jgi:hypothetical protein
MTENRTQTISSKLQYFLGVFAGLKLQNPLGVFAGWARYYHYLEREDYDGDIDLIAHPLDFQQICLWKPEGRFRGRFSDEAVRVGIYEVYASVCGMGYEQLKHATGAVELGEYFIVSLPWLLAQSTLVWASEPANQTVKRRVELLMGALEFKPKNKTEEAE